jgi:hypothetical protein
MNSRKENHVILKNMPKIVIFSFKVAQRAARMSAYQVDEYK